jgi:uncharacterized protein (TIGR00369 family)
MGSSSRQVISMSNVPAETFFGMMKHFYEETMPFNKLIGVKIESISFQKTIVRIDMHDDLIGNFGKGILSGGVISSVLDFTGGLIAQVHVLQGMKDSSMQELAKRLTNMSTIDIRVDYIRPGKGSFFRATGSILRVGNKVAVVRTELINDKEILIAAGTGTYSVG